MSDLIDIRQITIDTLKECQQSRDTEMAHYHADLALCTLLTSLGYADVVDAWKVVRKWYA